MKSVVSREGRRVVTVLVRVTLTSLWLAQTREDTTGLSLLGKPATSLKRGKRETKVSERVVGLLLRPWMHEDKVGAES